MRFSVLMSKGFKVFVVGHFIAMKDHKVGNFMVKDVSFGLDLEFGQKSFKNKLLIEGLSEGNVCWA